MIVVRLGTARTIAGMIDASATHTLSPPPDAAVLVHDCAGIRVWSHPGCPRRVAERPDVGAYVGPEVNVRLHRARVETEDPLRHRPELRRWYESPGPAYALQQTAPIVGMSRGIKSNAWRQPWVGSGQFQAAGGARLHQRAMRASVT